MQEKVGFFFKMREKKEAEEAFISSRKRIIKCHCAKNTILSALRSATVNDFEGFEVYYQPILDSADRIIGAEALLRFFMHSDEGDEMIFPG